MNHDRIRHDQVESLHIVIKDSGSRMFIDQVVDVEVSDLRKILQKRYSNEYHLIFFPSEECYLLGVCLSVSFLRQIMGKVHIPTPPHV